MVNHMLDSDFANTSIFITGASGFVGTWLLDSLLNTHIHPEQRPAVTALSRNPDSWRSKHNRFFATGSLQTITGDIQTPSLWEHQLPDRIDFVIHAAYDSAVKPGVFTPLQTLDCIISGTRNIIEAGVRRGARRVLFVSSGAVYGAMPSGMKSFPETYTGGPDPLSPGGAYGEGKRAAEAWGAAYCREHAVDFLSARLFAFGGPYLPLDQHFAFGNFIADALAKRPVQISGSGKSVRSWLFGGDLGVWLLRILSRGRSGSAYNVGSDEAYSIAELAQIVSEVAGIQAGVQRIGSGTGADSIYVPDISRSRSENLVTEIHPLRETISLTLKHYRTDPGKLLS